MQAAVRVPVTVKCRIGIDDQDSEAALDRFVSTVAATGCRTFIVHARKAWLKGLSPKENREIPPLDYDRVYRLKSIHHDLNIIINGGISSNNSVKKHLEVVDGAMLGRTAYQQPWLLASVDPEVFGVAAPVASRSEVLDRMRPYIAEELARGTWLSRITRHMLGLYHGEPGGRLWRRVLSEGSHRNGAGLAVIDQALACVDRPALALAAE
jgi:tRNA-dihydrouridine synthase A